MASQEQLLQYVWKYKLYPQNEIVTSDGKRVEVIDPGTWNNHSGPDFFNAKLRIGGVTWAGNIEIHNSSSEWYWHGHHLDPAYNSVILHLAARVNKEIQNQEGKKIPQAFFSVPEKIKASASYLLNSDHPLPCKDFIPEMNRCLIRSRLDDLGFERLHRKCSEINTHLERFNHSWDEVFYVILSRNFGFGINSRPFELLALSLPFNYILRHNDNIVAVEALLFGQAGLLENDVDNDSYRQLLQREYQFLGNKYGLKGLEGYLFRKMRVRPYSFPHIRIAQLASLLQQNGRIFSTILETEEPKELKKLFRCRPSAYWQTHYSFGKESARSPKLIGSASLDILLINTVAPILFAYGKATGREELCDRAVELLFTIKAEQNHIVRMYTNAGINPQNAFDSQALIQLKKEYCDQKKCLYCGIGYALLSSSRPMHR